MTHKTTATTIMLAAGGTGGHLFPAEALAAELLSRGHKVVIVTDKRGNAFKSLSGRVTVETVKAGYLRPGLISKARAVLDMGIGIVQALLLLRRHKPALVVGFGGYPSFPAMFAAQKTGIPTLLHEQNAVLGKANVWLADKAEKIATALPGTRGITPANAAKAVTTGNPVRADIVAARGSVYAAPQPEGDFNVFITGGSQAASVFSEIVPEAVGRLPEAAKRRLRIVHQCRENDLDVTADRYRKAGVKAEIKTFFNDMAARLSSCHLFIGRSGASTVAEISAVGRPAVFVPYPGHSDMQQKHNADSVANAGGGWVMMQPEFTPEALADKLEQLMAKPDMLDKAALAAKSCGAPDAAGRLADLVEAEARRIGAPKP